MTWLSDQRNMQPVVESDSWSRAEQFALDYGFAGCIVSSAYDEVDTHHSGMPGEYLGYAERFIKSIGGMVIDVKERNDRMLPYLVEELVRRSYHASQTCYNPAIKGRWVTGTDIFRISRLILEGFRKYGLKLEDLHTS